MKAPLLTTLWLLAMIVPGPLFATDYYVNATTGDDNWDGLAPVWDGLHGPKATIQAGIDAASDNDIVFVAEGTYTGQGNRDLDLGGKAITVRSTNPSDPDVVAATMIDCQGTGAEHHRGFSFHSGETVNSIVKGLTIKNGYHDGGGGISCISGSSPKITNCTISANNATGAGGGILCTDGSDATIMSCVLRFNSAESGGALAVGESSPAIEYCVLWSNAASGSGGAIYCNKDASPTIRTSIITENQASGAGGGISSMEYPYSPAQPTISNCTIARNDADWGGGISCSWCSNPIITNCTVSGNTAQIGAGMSFWYNCTPDITNCTISDNMATGQGGGIGTGYYDGADGPRLTNCLIKGNNGDPAGGIYCSAGLASAVITNCSITANTGVGVYCGSPTVKITNSILWGDGPQEIGGPQAGDADVTYCDVEGGWDGLGNIPWDPRFISGPLHDYYLSQQDLGQGTDSPCLDAGSDAAVQDFLWLFDLTTRTDGAPDGDDVPGKIDDIDMGYHAPFPVEITDVYWDQDTTSVVITFTSQEGVGYVLEKAGADAYSDALLWTSALTKTGETGSTSTVTDDLTSNPLAAGFRFYRIKHQDYWHYSRQTPAVFELGLDIDYATRQFFISTPLKPDPDHASVQAVLSTQLHYTNVKLDRLDADAGLYFQTTYDPNTGEWSDPFDIVPGEGYMLDVGDAYAIPHTVRLTGYVPEKALEVSVTRASYAVSERWMAYSMPRPTTLGGLGLETAITPFWVATNEVRLLPLGSVLWQAYRWDGVNWVTEPGGVIADATPIACGEGILFIHDGIPEHPDVLEFETWYLHPPNTW